MISCNGFKEFFRILKLHMAHMDKDGFVRHLVGLDRYMLVDESMSSRQIGSETSSEIDSQIGLEIDSEIDSNTNSETVG